MFLWLLLKKTSAGTPVDVLSWACRNSRGCTVLGMPELPWMYCPGHAGTPVDVLSWACRNQATRTNRLEGEAATTRGLCLGRFKVLRNLRDCAWVQGQGHHTRGRVEERDVERGNARRSSLKGREGINHTNIGTVLKATLGKLLRDTVEPIWVFPSA